MLDVNAVRKAVADAIGAGTDLRTFAYMPSDVNPPCAVVAFPEEVKYDLSFGRGHDELTLQVIVLVKGAQAEAAAQRRLDQYLNSHGQNSVKEAVEADRTLGGTVSDVRVATANAYGDVIGPTGVTHLGVTFTLNILSLRSA